jgi:hypothetical protein
MGHTGSVLYKYAIAANKEALKIGYKKGRLFVIEFSTDEINKLFQ